MGVEKKSSFTDIQAAEYELYMRMSIADGFYLPNDGTFKAANALFPRPACELVIFRNAGSEVLLTVYEKPWFGSAGWWHLPGGYMSNGDKNIPAVCESVATRELGISVRAPIGQDIGTYWWNLGEHDIPGARPLSIYVVAELVGEFRETDNAHFFRLADPPQKLISGAHRNFFEKPDLYLGVARCKGLL